MERRPQRQTDLPALPVFGSCYPNRRLPLTPLPTISRMIVRVSLAAFFWRQGGICDIAHQPCDVVIDLLLAQTVPCATVM